MPTVPRYDAPQAQSTPLPSKPLLSPELHARSSAQAQQTLQLGQGVQHLGGEIGKITLDLQQQANLLRFNDAQNQAKEQALRLKYDPEVGYLAIKGFNALQRDSGKPLAAEYGELYREQITRIEESLGNSAQRLAFRAWADEFAVGFEGGVLQHESSEFSSYALSVSEGGIRNAQQTIGLEWRNLAVVQQEIAKIQAETYRTAQLTGQSAEWVEAQTRQATSSAHSFALLAALDHGDWRYADDYLKRFASQMSAQDLFKVKGLITTEMNNQIAAVVAGEVWQEARQSFEPSEVQRAFNILIGTESKGEQFDAGGESLTSSAGAIGIAQVMPETAPDAARYAGLPFDEARYKNDASYNYALGFAYFKAMLTTFEGDLEQAYAAYNAGPKRVRSAIQKAGQPQNQDKSYLDFLPRETQNYVAINMGQFGAGVGRAKPPSLYELQQRVHLDPRVQGHPARVKVALEDIERNFNAYERELKRQGEEAVAEAQQLLQINQGRYEDLPVTLRARIPPHQVDDLMDYGAKVNRPAVVSNPWLYNKLVNPDFLKSLSNAEFNMLKKELTESDFKYFSKERAKLYADTTLSGSNSPDDLNSTVVARELNYRFNALGVDATPKEGSSASKRMGETRQAVNHYLLAVQRELGRKLTPAELVSELDKLIVQESIQKGLLWNSSKINLELQVSDIKPEQLASIKQLLASQGIHNPTNAQILATYWRVSDQAVRDKERSEERLRRAVESIPKD